MAQFAVLIAGLLVIAESQANDVADSSALQGFLSKYVPAATLTQRTPTSLNAYVPQGLSEAEYKAAKNAEDAKKAQNKQRFPKGKATLDIADWLKQMEQKQTFKGDQFSGSGHTYAKQKFESKNEFDKAKGRTSGGPSFKNPFSKFVLPAVSNMQRMPTSLNGYVPQGLSEAEWKTRQKDEAAKRAQNKLKYPKGKAFIDVKKYLKDLANKQTFKNGKVDGTGHAYVKTKYDWSGAKKRWFCSV